MTKLDQSTASVNALPLSGDSRVRSSSDSQGKATWQRTVLLIAAWFEILVGASFVLALNLQSQMLFGATVEGAGAGFGRLAGIALIGLGVACLPAKLEEARQRAVRVLFVYNIGAAILIAWIGATTTFSGVVLWPIVLVHAVIALALALSLRQKSFNA